MQLPSHLHSLNFSVFIHQYPCAQENYCYHYKQKVENHALLLSLLDQYLQCEEIPLRQSIQSLKYCCSIIFLTFSVSICSAMSVNYNLFHFGQHTIPFSHSLKWLEACMIFISIGGKGYNLRKHSYM